MMLKIIYLVLLAFLSVLAVNAADVNLSNNPNRQYWLNLNVNKCRKICRSLNLINQDYVPALKQHCSCAARQRQPIIQPLAMNEPLAEVKEEMKRNSNLINCRMFCYFGYGGNLCNCNFAPFIGKKR